MPKTVTPVTQRITASITGTPKLFSDSTTMGDTLCSGLAYLFSCCCFCTSADPGSDGSGWCSGSRKSAKARRDPREKALKQEFMDRGYRKDAVSGRIHVENQSQSVLMAAAIGQRPSSESTPRQGSTPNVNEQHAMGAAGKTLGVDPPT